MLDYCLHQTVSTALHSNIKFHFFSPRPESPQTSLHSKTPMCLCSLIFLPHLHKWWNIRDRRRDPRPPPSVLRGLWFLEASYLLLSLVASSKVSPLLSSPQFFVHHLCDRRASAHMQLTPQHPKPPRLPHSFSDPDLLAALVAACYFYANGKKSKQALVIRRASPWMEVIIMREFGENIFIDDNNKDN